MSNDKTVTLDTIHSVLLQQAVHLGAIDGRLAHVETDLAVVREAYVNQGVVIAQLHTSCCTRERVCAARLKRISEEVGLVREDTGALKVEDIQRRTTWGVVAKIAAGVIALGGAVVAVLQFWR